MNNIEKLSESFTKKVLDITPIIPANICFIFANHDYRIKKEQAIYCMLLCGTFDQSVKEMSINEKIWDNNIFCYIHRLSATENKTKVVLKFC